MKKQPPTLTRAIFYTKEGYFVKTTENGQESWSGIKTKWELRTDILNAGVCEYTADRMIAAAMLLKKDPNSDK